MDFRKGHRHQASSISSFFSTLTAPSTPAPAYTQVPTKSESALPSPLSTPSKAPRHWRRQLSTRSTGFTAIIVCVCIFGLSFLSVQTLRGPAEWEEHVELQQEVARQEAVEVVLGQYDVQRWVRGPPTESFRDNLLPGVKYITSWPCAGWTNDVMALVHLIYLAVLTERVPILPAFSPSHIGQAAGHFPFGEIFDLPRLAEAIHLPILEWRNVKNPTSTRVEEIGCWSSWMGGERGNSRPRDSYLPSALGLDISYTPTPQNMKVYGDGDFHTLYGRLMQLGFPSGRREALSQVTTLPAAGSGVVIEPDEHLMCFDFLYYTSLDRNFEWYYDWSPQWRLVATHMRWSPTLEQVSREYLNRHFGTSEEEEPPKFISVHARRGDFHHSCPGGGFDCLPSIEQLQQRVEEVRAEIFQRNRTYIEHVLVMSDERDPVWWQEVKDNGWGWIDHRLEKTEERYGPWYVPLLDAVFQSAGVGFVGTDGSTMSLVAARRVQDWHGGPVTYLTWKGL